MKKNIKTDPRISKQKQQDDNYDPSLPNCIICDLDGTLSLMNGRSPFEGKDCGSDLLHVPVAILLDMIVTNNMTCDDYVSGKQASIILMSGRNSDKGGREATENWLSDNGVNYDELHMRKESDRRSDTIIKKEMYEEHIKGKYNVLFCLDDRPSVIRLWESLGLTVFDVHPSSGEF